MPFIIYQVAEAPTLHHEERASELGQISNLYQIELDCGVAEEQDVLCSSMDSLMARLGESSHDMLDNKTTKQSDSSSIATASIASDRAGNQVPMVTRSSLFSPNAIVFKNFGGPGIQLRRVHPQSLQPIDTL